MSMKKLIYFAFAISALTLGSCTKLDLNPLSEPSSENWYADAQQIEISLNDMYRKVFYGIETEFWTDRRTDDWAQRDQVYDLCNGATTAATSTYSTFWTNTYKPISRANRVIEAIEVKHNDDPALAALKAEAKFFRAYMYARLVVCWGDAPFYLKTLSIEESQNMTRTDKKIITEQVLKDYDDAIEGLPDMNNGSGVYRVTKGAAIALKARFCAMIGDYRSCADLCKRLMDGGKYSLYYSAENPADSYGELFRDKTYNTEQIFMIANAYAYEQTQAIKSWVLRTAGGNNTAQPSWDLLAAYECTDGKTIDQSPLFDCHDPFANRDPRCCMTFAAPGTEIYGVIFDPHPSTLQVMDVTAGKMVKNKDTKPNDNYAAYNSCCLRKGAQMEWRTGQYNENPESIIRYADVLLMYAESKIELGEIDGTVLNAINQVRARAYGVSVKETGSYPAITTTDKAELRKIVRRERRVELTHEGVRFFDLKRWGLLKKCYSIHYYGHKNATGIKDYAAQGYWFWPETPAIDEDGFADFETMYNKGYIERYGFHVYDPKVELFPIPDEEIKANIHLTQNTGY